MPLSTEALAAVDRVVRAQCGHLSERDLAEAVVALSRIYTRERDHIAAGEAENDRSLAARAGFFLVRDLPKIFGPLDELAALGRLVDEKELPHKKALRVLDVGAGLGATTLGLSRFLRLRDLPVARIEVVALEQSAQALRTFGALARALSGLSAEFVPIALDARRADLRTARVEGPFDLVLFGFVLNELFGELPPDQRVARRASILRDAARLLAPNGAIVVLEPALKESTRELMALRDELSLSGAAPFVLAPCLHAEACPMLTSERDWCHQELPYALPPALARVARAAGLRYEGLSYASLVLGNTPGPTSTTAGTAYRIVSDPLASKGKLELFGCSAQGYVRLSRLTRDESRDNQAFGEVRRGDVLTIAGPTPRLTKETVVRRER